MKRDRVKEIEKKFNEIVRRLGIPVKVVYNPDPYNEDHGKYIPGENIIIIHDADPEKAYETLIHEILEYRLYPLIKKYKILINKLIEFYDSTLNIEKELTFEKLVKDIKILSKNGIS